MYYFSVFLHIIAAAFWIGGMLFLPLVLLPGIKDNPQRIELLYKTGITFRFYGLVVLAILLVTGFTNMYGRGISFSWAFFTQTAYGHKVLIKIGLFALILLLNAIHDLTLGKRAIEDLKQGNNERFRRMARWSGRLVLLVSLAMAYLGVMLSRGGEWIM